MNDTKNIAERKRTAKLIAKTRESIRKKHRALKTGIMESDIALEKKFKPIVEPLRQIVDITERDKPSKIRDVVKVKTSKGKREHSDNDDDDDNDDVISKKIKQNRSPLKEQSSNVMSKSIDSQHHFPSTQDEEVFETSNDTDPSLETSVREVLSTPQGRDRLNSQLGPLGHIYINAPLTEKNYCGDKRNKINHVYGVYFDENGTMLGDKKFDVDTDDTIIIDGNRYKGTPGLYELIFKRLHDDDIYTEDDKQTYKSILLTTNTHRRRHNAEMPIKSNKGYKYKYIIGPLVSAHRIMSLGAGVPTTMRVTDDKVDYVHWDDSNELVDRLQLLDASRTAGNNAHDNEILSIIEELREAGFIIN
ncbi:hypothetical protein ALC62_06193 [Cyphomyrmex costatus]|uniref:DUF8207 domain-containing protein n=1 Tax=Cyphomyrmex costatus TaxID=456900 RepID=A0A151IJ72_9HYME|nr:hypothetical protein ALC62_06193 [Cyphomyrmex costatus]